MVEDLVQNMWYVAQVMDQECKLIVLCGCFSLETVGFCDQYVGRSLPGQLPVYGCGRAGYQM